MTPAPALWVSQSLHFWSAPDSTGYAQDIQQVDDDQRRWYHRLCPQWYAWIYRSMPEMLRRAEPDEATAQPARYATMHRWAIAHIGIDRLRAALAAPTPTYYWPPGHNI